MNDLRDFALERFFARWEFTAPHMLSASDCEPLTIRELLDVAGQPADALLDLGLGYTEAPGSLYLRERIATFYPGLGPDDVLVTNAPEEAIFLAMMTLATPGARVVVQTPCYQALAEIARWRGADVVPWPMVETDSGWTADLERLDELLGIPTNVLVINAPHNPTGWLPTRAEYDRIRASARKTGARLFMDEMYRGLEHDPRDALPPAAALDDRAVSLWGMSKAFGLGGLRIGWLVSQDQALLDEALRLKDYTSICATAPGERLAFVALGAADLITARHRLTIDKNLSLLRAFAERTGVLAWRAPKAGSIVFPRWLPGAATAFCERAARDAGCVVVPASTFAWGDDHVRFGLGRSELAAGLAVLEQALPTLRG